MTDAPWLSAKEKPSAISCPTMSSSDPGSEGRAKWSARHAGKEDRHQPRRRRGGCEARSARRATRAGERPGARARDVSSSGARGRARRGSSPGYR
jgi:hypothetical protein